MRMGRTCPDLDAELFFELDEIGGAYLLCGVKQPSTEAQRGAAFQGGFLGRKGDGEPGAKALWLGLKEVRVAAKTLHALRAVPNGGTYV
jgi:hypothetical protein